MNSQCTATCTISFLPPLYFECVSHFLIAILKASEGLPLKIREEWLSCGLMNVFGLDPNLEENTTKKSQGWYPVSDLRKMSSVPVWMLLFLLLSLNVPHVQRVAKLLFIFQIMYLFQRRIVGAHAHTHNETYAFQFFF